MATKTKLILYGIEMSPPCRAVLLTLKALNLDYEFREINIAVGENFSEEFVEKNPQHTVPLLEDDGFLLPDSHAICAYLVRKYERNTNDDLSLYPKDHKRRAIVDQRLHYETGVLFHTCLKQITRPLLYENSKNIPQEKIQQIYDSYTIMETFLGEHLYMADSDNVTIADFSIVSTVSSFNAAFAPVDANNYPRLAAWLERMAQLPYYAVVNVKGVKAFRDRIESKLPKQFDKLWQKAVADIKGGKQ